MAVAMILTQEGDPLKIRRLRSRLLPVARSIRKVAQVRGSGRETGQRPGRNAGGVPEL